MPTYDTRCLGCGYEREVFVSAGVHPPCVVCSDATEYVWRKGHSVIGDEIDETHPDLDPDGGVIRFRSRQEKQRYLDAHQLEPFVRWAGPNDRHVKRWDVPSAYGLEQAAILVARVAEQSSKKDAPIVCETATFSVKSIAVEDIL